MPCAPAASLDRPVITTPWTIALRVTAVLALMAAAWAVAACGSINASTGQNSVGKPNLTVAVVPATSVAGR